ncbi:hypothetical protein KRR40_12535 [Niabella defluvii]|nr:hypothetical protein KRR40_12535 [Niabella sp. I65]
MRYPNYKFITREEVNRLCEKYGLIFGRADKYTGDIPEKNLLEIEAFYVNNEDVAKPNDIENMIEAIGRASTLFRNGGITLSSDSAGFGILDDVDEPIN